MKRLTLIIAVVFSSLIMPAQQFKKAPDDKALVYFVRTSRMGYAINFKYFDGDKFIGIFNNKGYITYECDPGEHILWMVPGGGGKTDYIIAILEEGKTYVVEAKAKGKLNPLSMDDEKDIIDNTLKVVNKKEEVTMSEEDKAKRNIDYAEFIETKLSDFDDMVYENYTFKRITSANALPDSYLNSEDSGDK